MADIADAFAETFADTDATGAPVRPAKAMARALGAVIEARVGQVEALATIGLRWLTQTIRVRAIGNVDISTALESGDVLNGVTLVAGDHVFLGAQTNQAENGLYTVPASGAASRATFADSAAELALIAFRVAEGDLGAGQRWILPLEADQITLGTTALTFVLFGADLDAQAAEAAAGRGALYGFTDLVEARLFAEESWEADFVNGYYRDGLVPSTSLSSLPDWAFSRNSAATAEPAGADLVEYAAHEARIINRGLLIEGGRAEGLGYTSDFGSWSATNITLTTTGEDYAGVPFTKVEATAGAGTDFLRETSAIGAASGATTFWCIVKKGTGAEVGNRFAIYNITQGASVIIAAFNYDTGVITYDAGGGVTSGGTATALGEGCWLLAFTPPTGIADGDQLRCRAGFIGLTQAAGDHFFMSRANVQNGPFPTSYIENNTGAQASRLSDVAITDLTETGDFTVFIEADMGAHSVNEALFAAVDAGGSNGLVVFRDASGVITAQSINAGVITEQAVATKTGARRIRLGLTSLPESARISVDGATPVEVAAVRPRDLSILTLGRESTSGQAFLNGYVRRVMAWSRGATDAQLQAMTRTAGLALADAPLTGHPLQGRFNPVTGATPDGEYGRLPVATYGTLPCALLVCELKGPSATAISADGSLLWRDTAHLGRWVDVDPENRRCLVGDADPRTIRWLDPDTGVQLHAWEVPVGTPGELYGVRITGGKLVVNVVDGTDCEIWIFDLDGDRYPTGSGTKFTGYEGVGYYARSMLIDTSANLLWIASLSNPTNPQGCEGAVQAYNLTTGALVHDLYGHYPNDVDQTPAGEIVWADEHLDRLRAWNPTSEEVRSLMAGLQVRYDYEPAVSSISANTLATRTLDGSNLSGCAVEYRGLKGLYAPNGCRAISNDLFVIADTDNGRVIVARVTTGWEPEIVAVIGLFNEPTKAVPIPAP